MIPETWYAENQRRLVEGVAAVRACLEGYLARAAGEAPAPPPAAPEPPERPVALDSLCLAFDLSDFERDVLLLCAGVEIDASFAALVARAQNSAHHTAPTFGLAMSTLPGAYWSAITPDAPLRRWRLIELGAGDSLVLRPLRIDERVLHHLTGVTYLDESLQGLVEYLTPPASLPPTQMALAERIARDWSAPGEGGGRVAVQLTGWDAPSLRAVAAQACAIMGLNLHAMPAGAIPALGRECETLARLWEREAALTGSALLLELDEYTPPEQRRAAAEWAGRVHSRVLTASGEPVVVPNRRTLRFDVDRPLPDEQRHIWTAALGELNGKAGPLVDRLVAQFNLTSGEIHAAVIESCRDEQEALSLDSLWSHCRRLARPRVDDLAQRIDSQVDWDDLVLPPAQGQILRSIAAHVRNRTTVYQTWGFAARSQRGLGISALFAGPSGTGKTLAAEVLAHELRLDLYRIDLSALVSKYIGETEKNLRRVFDAAEAGGAILLFDEADALFGKRSEVQDSHDRYANIEVSYLLQRMEAYRGLAILTTNLKSALDPAFLRRIRFIVQFPFPDFDQRRQIWERIFPPAVPVQNIDPARLAQLAVAGGSIRNIALNAAFLAADEGQQVSMAHLLRAARAEYGKLEKSMTETEVKGWA